MSFTDEQKQFLHRADATQVSFDCVIFRHSDIDDINLVANQHFDRVFEFEGQRRSFKAVSMKYPRVSNQSEKAQKTKLQFGRIGMQVKKTMRSLSGKREALKVILLQINVVGGVERIGARYDFIAKHDGINIDENNATIQLSNAFYKGISRKDTVADPAIFVGLQNA